MTLKLPLLVRNFAYAQTAREARQLLDRHPELLGAAAGEILDEFMMAAQAQGDDGGERAFGEARRLLERCRTEGVAATFAEAIPQLDRPGLESWDQAVEAWSRYQRSGDRAALDVAVWAWDEVVSSRELHTLLLEHRLHALAQAGMSRSERFRHGGDLTDIGLAIRAFDELERWSPPGSPLRHAALADLGRAYLARHRWGGGLADLESAIDALSRSRAESPTESPDVGDRLGILGAALMLRYEHRGTLSDLDAAVESFEAALATGEGDTERRLSLLAVLGVSRTRRFERTGDVQALVAGLGALEAAVAGSARDSAALPGRLGALGAGLARLHDVTGDKDDLNAAIRNFEEAARAAPDEGARFNDLGNALLARHALGGDPADLRDAVDALERGVAKTPPAAAELPARLGNLANALRRRYERTGDRSDADRATEAYRRSCSEGLDVTLEPALYAAERWGRWASALGNWADAAEAYSIGLRAAGALYRLQLGRPSGELWLDVARALPAEAAYALAKVKDTEAAVTALEQGRALVFSDALERNRVELDHLSDLGRADLSDRYRELADRVHALEHVGPQPGIEQVDGATRARQLRQVRARLRAVVSEIRQVDGFSAFLTEPTFAQIAPASPPLAYIVAADHGGVILLVGEGPQVRTVWLPELTRQAVHDAVARFAPHNEARLDRLTAWLWHAVAEPLLRAEPSRHIVLVPVGLVALLPLHAAWTADPGSQNGRRYALDEARLTYAPTGASRRACLKDAGAPADALLAICDTEHLEHAAREVTAAANHFENVRRLEGAAATSERVLGELERHRVLHFACHGRADPDAPLASALLLPSGESLTVQRILSRRLRGRRLAVLSACETARLGTEMPDEVVGLPAAFIQTGVAGVIGSLWEVPDLSTMLLMDRFYELWRERGLDPSEALRQAQQWVRDAGGTETRRRFPDVSELDDGTRSHASPVHWAAFIYVGA